MRFISRRMKEKVPTKRIALKAIKEDCTLDDEESNDNDEEAFSLIVWGLNKMGQKKNIKEDSTKEDPHQKDMKNPQKVSFL